MTFMRVVSLEIVASETDTQDTCVSKSLSVPAGTCGDPSVVRACVLSVLRHRNGWPRDSTGMTCGSPSSFMRAGAAVRSLGESRVDAASTTFCSHSRLTDKWQTNSLMCNGAVGIRRHRWRSRCRSGGASWLRRARKRDFVAPQRAAYRTQSPAFLS